MDKKNNNNNVKFSMKSTLDYELPEITVSFEDSGTQYTFNGIYDGSRSVSVKLLKLMENGENNTKGADK